jgi:hypothetical protein
MSLLAHLPMLHWALLYYFTLSNARLFYSVLMPDNFTRQGVSAGALWVKHLFVLLSTIYTTKI